MKGPGGWVSGSCREGKVRWRCLMTPGVFRLAVGRRGGRQPGLFAGSRGDCRIPRKTAMIEGICKVTRSLIRASHKATGRH